VKLKSIQEEIKSKMKTRNAYYHSVQNLLCSRLLHKNLKIKIYRTVILPVVLYGCETWSLTLREEHRLRVFENRVLGEKKRNVKINFRRATRDHRPRVANRTEVGGGILEYLLRSVKFCCLNIQLKTNVN
jgi:hypothetical protein